MTNWKRSSDAGTQDFGLKLHDPRLADALVVTVLSSLLTLCRLWWGNFKPPQWCGNMYGPPSDCKLNLCGECFGSAQMYPACLWS
jgi:hypothetical protein